MRALQSAQMMVRETGTERTRETQRDFHVQSLTTGSEATEYSLMTNR